jgi:hypothetical protein
MSEIDEIDTKLKKLRAASAEAWQAAEQCRVNRDSDPWRMDQERRRHLQVKYAADQQVVQLEFDRRCALPAGGSDTGWRPATPGFHGEKW